MANVVLEDKEYKKMVDEIHKLRKEKKELKKANKFLNQQIEEYNDEFAKSRK